jgi:hypothetical protein
MADVIRLPIDGIVERFKSLGPMLAPTVYVGLLASAKQMLRDVLQKRMSNPRRGSTSTNLGVDTGTARRSMVDRVGVTESTAFALLGSVERYVKAHEEGFHGTAHVRAYTRRNLSPKFNVRTGKLTKKYAMEYIAARRKGKKTVSYVRAHGRKVDIIAKHFIRDTVIEAAGPTADRITRGLIIAIKTGRVPSINQVGA